MEGAPQEGRFFRGTSRKPHVRPFWFEGRGNCAILLRANGLLECSTRVQKFDAAQLNHIAMKFTSVVLLGPSPNIEIKKIDNPGHLLEDLAIFLFFSNGCDNTNSFEPSGMHLRWG